MFGALKKGATDFVLRAKDLFTSPESQVYIKDLRKAMVYKDGRKCQYPKNYDQIVESGKIIEDKNSDDETVYKLLYGDKNKDGQPVFELTKVTETEIDNKSYFTIKFLVDKGRRDKDDYSGFYKPFGFSKIDLKKHIPVFEAQKINNHQYPLELTNSSVLTKKEKNKEGKVQEVIDEKGRNGELLYTSDYKKLNTSFSEIRDQSNNLELDKSLISVPIVFVTSLAKVCAKWLTYLPIKLGENLISKQNPIAKFFGYLLFTPAVAMKNSVNMGATILKAPILLFVANKEKYGDAYLTMWKYQLQECLQETKNDYLVVKNGMRSKPEKEDYLPLSIVGTWDELDARRPGIEEEMKKQKEESDKKVSEEQLRLQNTTKEPEIQEQIKAGHVNRLKAQQNLDKSVSPDCS